MAKEVHVGISEGATMEGQAVKTRFTPPTVVDYGSISAHTFSRAQVPSSFCTPDPNPHQNKQGDWRICQLDKFCEYSCPS
jgi:hypothetical protein